MAINFVKAYAINFIKAMEFITAHDQTHELENYLDQEFRFFLEAIERDYCFELDYMEFLLFSLSS